MTHEKLQYIGGQRRHGTSDHELSIIDPSTGTVLTTGMSASEQEVDDAVTAAHEAFPKWSRATPAARSDILLRWAQILRSRSTELSAIESRNGGKAIKLADGFDIPGVIDDVTFFATAARNLEGKASGEYSGA